MKKEKVLSDIKKNEEMIENLYCKFKIHKGKLPVKLMNEYDRLMKRKNLLMEDLERFS